MRFIRYTVTLGAAGLFTGLAYHNISRKRPFVISAVTPVNLDIENVISTDVKSYLSKYAPVMKHGFPSYDTLRLRGNFVLSYDRRNRVANWVMEHLTSDMFEAEACGRRDKSRFHEDDTIHGYFRSTKKDYENSGYDKGHLAAAANHKRSQREIDQTFVLSNITPQNWNFNQGIWEKLESHVRNLVKKYGSVYVCSGPLYIPRILSDEEEEFLQLSQNQHKKRKRKGNQRFVSKEQQRKKYIIYEVIGDNDVAVPTHFFKIILCEVKEDLYDMEAYIIPNEPVDHRTRPLEDFRVQRDAIERVAGFLLFNQLPPSAIRRINGKESDSSESEQLSPCAMRRINGKKPDSSESDDDF